MLALFSAAVFLAAAILFLVQPMAARLALPVFGGGPSVWNTAMVFFQVSLLAGYAIAHVTTRYLRPWAQVIAYAVLALAAAVMLPIAKPDGDLAALAQTPVRSLLWFLASTVGLPFLFVSAAGPLLQRWFSASGHRLAEDPYFLYAASNAGSVVGLLAYPLVIEPALPIRDQGLGWSGAMVVYAVLALACGVAMARARKAPSQTPTPARPAAATGPDAIAGGAVTWKDRRRWIFLAFVPSSLMLGVTQHITTDVAAAPLLWIIPLLIYLMTFIAAFGVRLKPDAHRVGRLTPWVVLALATVMVGQARTPVLPLAILHLLGFTLVALLCHTRLADARPRADRLTEYYLLISVGGALGGIFNALLAPVLFERVYEYPITLALACIAPPAIRWVAGKTSAGMVFRWAAGAFVTLAVMVAVELALRHIPFEPGSEATRRAIRSLPPALAVGTFLVLRWHGAFMLGLALLFVAAVAQPHRFAERTIYIERTFFGVHQVLVEPKGRWHLLQHGTTYHGVQYRKGEQDGRELRFFPTTYYSPNGPLGQVFTLYWQRDTLPPVAAVGLGAGTVAAYGQAGMAINFYEIDPAVVRIAKNPDLFTYLRDSDAEVRTILGDARLRLAESPDNSYGLIIVDAFTSDAIPVHLLTREAFDMYRRKLRDDGLIAIHISNRFFDLSPVIVGNAESLGMSVAAAVNRRVDPNDAKFGGMAADWVVIGKNPAAVAPLIARPWPAWDVVGPSARRVVWTDDYSSILAVVRWDK